MKTIFEHGRTSVGIEEHLDMKIGVASTQKGQDGTKNLRLKLKTQKVKHLRHQKN